MSAPLPPCRAARTRRRDAAGRPCCAACARVVDAGAGVWPLDEARDGSAR